MLCCLFAWPTSDLDSFHVSSHSRKASRPGKGVQFSEHSHCDNACIQCALSVVSTAGA